MYRTAILINKHSTLALLCIANYVAHIIAHQVKLHRRCLMQIRIQADVVASLYGPVLLYRERPLLHTHHGRVRPRVPAGPAKLELDLVLGALVFSDQFQNNL